MNSFEAIYKNAQNIEIRVPHNFADTNKNINLEIM